MDTLYHYCSTASFHAIVQSHSLWLSSLSLSNDTMEGKLVAHAFTRLAEKDSLDPYSVSRLRDTVGTVEKIIDGLGFCLSEDGDLLSQWRGYAADATGVSIGFSAEYLNWLSKTYKAQNVPNFNLQKVEYEPSAHESHIEPTYRKIRQLIDAGAFKTLGRRMLLDARTDDEIEQENKAITEAQTQLTLTISPIFSKLFHLKAYAFREEREWRLLSHLVMGWEDHCSHRVVHDRIVPYRKVELAELERSPITEVILGPKHGTPTKVVEDFLKQNQYGVVRVRSSEASYR